MAAACGMRQGSSGAIRGALFACSLIVPGLTGCADEGAAPAVRANPPPASAGVERARPAQTPAFPPADEQAPASATDQAGTPLTQNDPSAPLDTPLCGRAARERNQIGAALEPDVVAAAGACAQTACFDPATDTFIGADGFRHVCQ